ncbi:MAG: acyl--CoA ligase [Paracoccaceae bacterium]|jgi:acyl-CoA synthetase (AMP-forming)/AMP-acid ligase II
MSSTLTSMLAAHAEDAPAIGASEKSWLTYGALRSLSQEVRTSLRANGIGAKDRVAIVLPNGAAMASAFITIAQAATTAPLNPNYREDEFAFYLEDLTAKAIVLEAGYSGAAEAAARRQGLAILRLQQDSTVAGKFSLTGEGAGDEGDDNVPDQDDIALILHTSGTTSRPKIVPLLQSNVTASARNIAVSLNLTSSDRCLNVMPLFHIHGLIAAVASSLSVGASIWCTSGFNAMTFFASMAEAKPTWYTAVPTMHQAILSRAGRNEDTIKANPLRFLRSSSASLPAQVMEALRETFNAPVVEAYGMTEATHQMCCNPLERQKPGSVGVAAGPEVRIAHETENHLIEGIGEVVISGPNVTPGYESNPDANAKNFFEANGKRWFRTGDQGSFDKDGFLELTGRLKEIINRGGEKISPLEVDGVLMDFPAIAQVVTFALPHPKLGEEVAAAVVLREGQTATERDIRDFAATRMADFKVPRKVVILDEIPKGATGKMQRIGMAEKLGLVEKAG